MNIRNYRYFTFILLVVFSIIVSSCTIPVDTAFGTLVINLPESPHAVGSRAVFDDFIATLRYRIICTGPGKPVTTETAGGSSAISLAPGDWEVSVTVLNRNGDTVGSESTAVTIVSNETSSAEISITVDTSGKRITAFAITGPVQASGNINETNHTITVNVPYGTNVVNMITAIIHTGAAISPASGTADFSIPRTYSVIAGNGTSQDYIVTVNVASEPEPGDDPGSNPDNPANWPAASTWTSFGLAGLQQPSGTTVTMSVVVDKTMMVTLGSANQTAFNTLTGQIERITGKTGSTTGAMGYSIYELAYSGFTLNLMLNSSTNEITLAIETDAGGGSMTWPSNSVWASYGLAGLQQPSGTTVSSVAEIYSTFMVILNNASEAAYNNLRNQIQTITGTNALYSENESDHRADVFIYSGHTATLQWDYADDEIALGIQ
jgi:hypothetical protein